MSASFFIGRFSPFHLGHKAIVDQLLSEGKQVCIAIRNTPLSDRDPFTVTEREAQIRRYFPDEARVMITAIPDIAEVVYGRKVGYRIREVRLEPELEAISATALREMA